MSNDTLPYFNYPTTALLAVPTATTANSSTPTPTQTPNPHSNPHSNSNSNSTSPPTSSTSNDLLKYTYSYPTQSFSTKLPSISTLLTNSNGSVISSSNTSTSTPTSTSPPILRHPSLRSESLSSMDSFSRSNSIYNNNNLYQQQSLPHHLQHINPSSYSSSYSSSIFNNNSLDTLTNVATQSLSSKSSISSTSFLDFNLPRTNSSSDDDSNLIDLSSIQSSSSSLSSNTTTTSKSSKRRRSNLPKQSTNILFQWLHSNLDHPYPNSKEKIDLMRKTGLTSQQLSNWFINARRRKIQSLKEKSIQFD